MPGNTIGSAFSIYGLGTGSKPGTPAGKVNNPDAQYEYGQVGRLGLDTNNNGIREVDCSALVYNAMRGAGYYLPGSSTSSFTTRTLFQGDNLTQVAKDNFTSFEAKDVLTGKADLKPGDILLFKGVNGNTNQHTAIFYGYDESGKLMFYGSQTSTGPGIVTINKEEGSYWNGGKSELISALRPNESLYISQMDLTGGPGTGLSSPNVVAAVNLLKQSSVENYHATIYSNVDGVPTVGNGLTFVVRGTGGVWTVLPENQIKDLLRDVGLPESKYKELPLDKFKESADLLNQGKKGAAKAVFGEGEEGGFSVTPAEADKLTAAYIVRDVVPKVVNTLEGSDNLALMEPGEFAALASKLYQKPGWLGTDSGKQFIDAWWDDNTAAAQAALGGTTRGKAEADAYAGHVSTSNDNLGTGQGTTVPSIATLGGHWEYPITAFNAEGIFPGSTEPVWVPDVNTSTTVTSTSKPSAPGTGTPTGSDRTPYSANGTTTHNKDGSTTDSFIAKDDAPNGFWVKGDKVVTVRDVNGTSLTTIVTRTEGKTTTTTTTVTDPVTGDVTISFSVGKGADSVQFMERRDATGNLVGDSYVHGGVRFTRTPDAADPSEWLDPNGKTQVERQQQNVADSDAHLNKHPDPDPTNPLGANAVNGADLQSDQYKIPTPPVGEPTTASTTKPSSSLMTVGYNTVQRDGNEY